MMTAPLLLCLAAALSAPELEASRTFEFTYETTIESIPADANQLRLWIPLPQSDENQQISDFRVETTPRIEQHRIRRLRDETYGNLAMFIELDADEMALPESLMVSMIVTVERKETSTMRDIGDVDRAELLAADQMAPLTDEVSKRAADATAETEDSLARMRAIYDRVLADVDYDKSGEGWGRGDIDYVCEVGKGNCSDFHTLFIAMSRSTGVPAYFEIGFPLPADKTEGEVGGYHCWAWFETHDGTWRPVDASEADKDPSKTDYFFGSVDQHRIAFSRGRDIVFDPAPTQGVINFFIYPIAEIDGKPVEAKRKFSFRDVNTAEDE